MSSSKKRVFWTIAASFLLAVACMVLPPSHAWASEFPENDNLSEKQIADRFREINETYDVGEVFSDSDADFVLRYGNRIGVPEEDSSSSAAPQPRGSFSFSGSGYGTTVSVSGTIYHNGTFNYTYGANATISKTAGGTPQSMTFTVHCTAYGVVGNDGIGKIYDNGVSVTRTNTNSFYASPSRTYSGVMITYVVECWVDVTTSDGHFFTAHP